MGHSPLDVGDLIVVRFPLHQPPGHEQEGTRPALIVGLPARLGHQRFPTVLVAPLTSDRQQPWAGQSPGLYPRLAAGFGGLPSASLVLLDQLRAIDQSRLVSYLGSLTVTQVSAVVAAVQSMVAAPQPPAR